MSNESDPDPAAARPPGDSASEPEPEVVDLPDEAKPRAPAGAPDAPPPLAEAATADDFDPDLFEEQNRRDFLQKAGSVVIGGAIIAVPAAIGLIAVSDPLMKATQGGVVVRLTSIDALPEDGTPQIFKVVADKTDAWTTYKNLPLGLVFASRTADGKVVVFSASCPHAGCAVEYRNTEDLGKHYYCPCHASYFKIDGAIGNEDSPAARGLDTLEVDEEKLADGEVWVRFQKFKAGVAEKKAVS
ncbi:MAG: Rieske 2Fe-2S domain-containing protein [Akkermansiaceae bacterium]|nr:Rieske 2Fe-2S domain-containing protein [Akkermansiaceae bacterium]NNM31291.1 Rieske 2Fe-2S domain-containing protein [Akkermansiaceae bacterium]